MFLHNRFAHPATALLVVVFGVALFALPATSLSTGAPELHSLWTGTNLYVAIFVRDDAIVNDEPRRLTSDDEIELAFVGAWDGNPAGGDTHNNRTCRAAGGSTGCRQPSCASQV